MFKETFHTSLAKLRRRRNISLRKLHGMSGLDFRRLSRLENGRACPKPEERDVLHRLLGTPKGDLLYREGQPSSYYRRLRSKGRELRSDEIYYPPADRNSRQRYVSASYQYSDVMRWLVSIVESRADFEDINYFCGQLSLGSALECLHVTYLFANGGFPAFQAPSSVSPWLPNPIVCPRDGHEVGHRPFPCILLDGRVYFPQVTFATPRRITVDILRHSDGLWSVLEIDGRGHNPADDAQRTKQIRLPHSRLNESHILAMARQHLSPIINPRRA